MNKPSVVSIFSGGGGFDLGFHKSGYKIVLSTDNYKPAIETLQNNKLSENILYSDIRNIDYKNFQNIDVLIGGPPCPPYSKSRFYLKNKSRALNDENSFTLSEYIRGIDQLKPKVFVFENVFGFVYKPHKNAFDLLKDSAEKLGYKLSYKVINCANYGIPQTRERFFCIGVQKNLSKFVFPKETHSSKDKNLLPWVTAGEVLSDLDYPLPEDSDKQAGAKHKHLLKLIPDGENYLYLTEKKGYPKPEFKWRSRYWSFLLKLGKNRPSWTIQASFSNNQGPFHWTNRFLRINEIKRIQTFDDNYKFSGKFKEKWVQIGNAVPVLMAEILAREIKNQYFSN